MYRNFCRGYSLELEEATQKTKDAANKPTKPDTTPEKKADAVRKYFERKRVEAARSESNDLVGKRRLAPKLAAINAQERAGLSRLSRGKPLAYEQGIETDSFGHFVGETRVDQEGKMWRYGGNDTWEVVGQTGRRGQWRVNRMEPLTGYEGARM